MRVFLDANIYLKFIRSLSDKRLDSLSKFKEYADNDKFTVIFPQITQDEVFRKIPRLTNKSLAIFSNLLPNKSPMKMLGNEISNEAVDKLRKEWKKETSKIEKSFDKKIEKVKSDYTTSVEKLIRDIIEPLADMSEKYDEDDEIMNDAKQRKLKGNPPGKRNDPLGDEIAWELLKKNCTDDDLVIISDDSDWRFIKNDKILLQPLLQREWNSVSDKNIILKDTVGSFINTIKKKEVSKREIEKEKNIPSIVDDYVVSSISPSPHSHSLRSASDSSVSSSGVISSGLVSTLPLSVGTTTATVASICPKCSRFYFGEKCDNCTP